MENILPKEILDLIGTYHDPDEKGLIPFMISENAVDNLPKEIQNLIGDYLPLVDYKDLVVTAKLAPDKKIDPNDYQVIRRPWSEEKLALAHDQNLYQIVKEAYLQDLLSFDPSKTISLFLLALDNEDYPMALQILKEDHDVIILAREDIFKDAIISLKTIRQDCELETQMDYDSKLTPLELPDANQTALTKCYRKRISSLHRRFNFLIDNFLNEAMDLKISKYLPDFVLNNWIDTLEKIGRYHDLNSFDYITVLVKCSLCDNLFRQQIKRYVASPGKITESDLEEIAQIIFSYSYNISRHLKIIEEEGASKLVELILD